jgi:raffinose/stachyose/melibiose transport system permease protein
MTAHVLSPHAPAEASPARTSGAPAPRRVRDRHHRGPVRWLVLAGVVVGAVVMMAPIVIMLLNAFKSPAEYAANGPLALPTELYTQGLVNFWTRVDYPQKLVNSVVISGAVAVGAVVVSLLSAYALGIGRVKGRLWIIAVFLLANMLPQEALVYPLYHLAKQTGLYNTQLVVILIFIAIQSAFGTYLLSSVLSTFPRSILEAAALDGAGRRQILWRVVYPISRPTLAVLLIFFFIWTWNEFFIPLVMLIDNATQTIPVALASLQGDRLMDAPTINAGSLISLLPAVLFFLFFQRTLTRGITAGAVK